MLAKIYFYTWLVLAAAFVALYIAGAMTPTVIVVFGMFVFGMVFGGMIGVLPSVVSHPGPYAEATMKMPTEGAATPIQHGAHSVRA